MLVKILNRVPLPGADGEAYYPTVGEQVEVPQNVGEALLRGEDAVKVREPPSPTEVVEPKAPRKRRSKKSAGSAPEDKNAGAAPEDK